MAVFEADIVARERGSQLDDQMGDSPPPNGKATARIDAFSAREEVIAARAARALLDRRR